MQYLVINNLIKIRRHGSLNLVYSVSCNHLNFIMHYLSFHSLFIGILQQGMCWWLQERFARSQTSAWQGTCTKMMRTSREAKDVVSWENSVLKISHHHIIIINYMVSNLPVCSHSYSYIWYNHVILLVLALSIWLFFLIFLAWSFYINGLLASHKIPNLKGLRTFISGCSSPG